MAKRQSATTETGDTTATTPGAKEELAVEHTPESQHTSDTRQTSGWSLGKLFWGLLFVVIGGLLLLDNFNVIEVDLGQVWRLWPLLIVFGGVSLLSVRGALWRLVAIVLTVLALVAVVVVATGGYTVPTGNARETSVSVEQAAQTNRLQTAIKSGAGKITVTANDTEALVAARLQSDVATLSQTSRQRDGVQIVDIATEFRDGWQIGSIRNDLEVSLSERVPLQLSLDAGASEVDLDLQAAILEALTLKLGASSAAIQLGDKAELSRLTIEAGASAITLEVPQGVGVRVKKEAGLASVELPGLQDKGNSVFESDGYERSVKKIDLTLKIGAGSFTLRR